MDRLVEEFVRRCARCELTTKTSHPSPFTMSKMPTGPWEEVSVDLYGPLRSGNHLLVVMDEFYRYPVVHKVTSTAARVVIPALRQTFAMFGVPLELKSDNGAPFQGHEFKAFAKHQGFRHHRVTPY